MSTQLASAYPLCRHIKTNGHRCQSPALRGQSLCHFHRKLRAMHRPAETPQASIAQWTPQSLNYFIEHNQDPLAMATANQACGVLKVLPLEDAESIQLVISTLFSALANREIDKSHARLLLHALQLASYNVRAIPRNTALPPYATTASATAVVTASDGSSAIAHASTQTGGCPIPAPLGWDEAATASALAPQLEPRPSPLQPQPQPQPIDEFARNPNPQTNLPAPPSANSSNDTNFP
jgi:hypothetical protein